MKKINVKKSRKERERIENKKQKYQEQWNRKEEDEETDGGLLQL